MLKQVWVCKDLLLRLSLEQEPAQVLVRVHLPIQSGRNHIQVLLARANILWLQRLEHLGDGRSWLLFFAASHVPLPIAVDGLVRRVLLLVVIGLDYLVLRVCCRGLVRERLLLLGGLLRLILVVSR